MAYLGGHVENCLGLASCPHQAGDVDGTPTPTSTGGGRVSLPRPWISPSPRKHTPMSGTMAVSLACSLGDLGASEGQHPTSSPPYTLRPFPVSPPPHWVPVSLSLGLCLLFKLLSISRQNHATQLHCLQKWEEALLSVEGRTVSEFQGELCGQNVTGRPL